MDTSMVSTTSNTSNKPPSPINGIGRLLGSAAIKLFLSSKDNDKVIKFIISLGLLFNLRIKLKPIPNNGFYTFFVETPREECFNPIKISTKGDSYVTSFKIREETLSNFNPVGSPFDSVTRMTWSELRSLTAFLLPEQPRSLNEFKEIMTQFTPELMSQEGSISHAIGADVRAIRVTLDEVASKNNLSDLL